MPWDIHSVNLQYTTITVTVQHSKFTVYYNHSYSTAQ